ncbi:MAG TPA: alpha-amylase family glycosyl hydrolase [Anaeromyxobacteraceae bacterium]|nr:alpha-amylase family glycosyl hydrolase [Anaeromyxobacteraceae bacterium]
MAGLASVGAEKRAGSCPSPGEVRQGSSRPLPGGERPGVAPCIAALLLALASCAHPGAPAPTAPAAALAPLPDRDWRDEVLYFVLVDRFADGDPSNDAAVDRAAKGAFHGGDLEGLTAHLDEIASLGVTALWVNPLVKNIDGFVTGAGFPDWAYHGYWADDLGRLDPRFGDEADLRALVAACHARGIRVLLDVVYNHPGYGTHYLRDPRTRGWLRSTEIGGCGDDDLTSCLAGLPDWKTELPEVRDFLLDHQLSWARRFGLDGFRLDTLKHVSHDFWQVHRRRTRAEVSPGFFLLGELWGGDAENLDAYFAPDEIDAGFDFSFPGSALGWVQGRGRTVAFDRYLRSREKVRAGHHLAHFLSSHDVPGALHQLAGDKALFRLAAVLQLTVAGIPVVYYGEEVGRPGGAWPDNRSDMPWGDRAILPGRGLSRDDELREFYRRVVAARRAHPALSRGKHEAISTEGDLYVFQRRDTASGDAVVVALNRGSAEARATFAPLPEWNGLLPVDALAAVEATAEAGRLTVRVPPRSAAILAPVRR